MAIPTWLWHGDSAAESDVDVERASAAFETLASTTRLSILTALADADEPLSYTALRTASGLGDNGRFNYHLRQLDGFVAESDGTYALTDRGRRLVDDVVRHVE